MRDSFREIAQFMDSVEPAVNLRRLLDMHQLEEGDGFAEVWRRHNHTELQEKRFLFWNTFLMDFLRGITPDSKLAKTIGRIFLGPALDIAAATEEITALIGKSVWERFQPDPHKLPFKPAVESRAKEIGNLVSRNSSVSALCEVWTNREKEWLLDSWNNQPAGHNSEISERPLQSSGLITISNEFSVMPGGFHRYNAESGEDLIVGKGALLTHIDVNSGTAMLDVYSTHLNAGDMAVKLMQFIELISFIERTRASANPAILVGDFNLNSHHGEVYSLYEVFAGGSQSRGFWDTLRLGSGVGSSEFSNTVDGLSSELRSFFLEFNGTINQFMEGALSILGFKDLWKHRNELSSGENRGHGYTTDLITAGTPDQICPVRPGSEIGICEESLSVPERATRIDYMFVSNTDSNQSFTLDFTRPERFRADRATDAPDRDEIAFMSDHLGLTTNMLLVPR